MPLNDTGTAQATQLADALAVSQTRVDVIATSHLLRAIGTADAIASVFPSAARATNPLLREMLYGDLEDRPTAEVGAEIRDIAASWRAGTLDSTTP